MRWTYSVVPVERHAIQSVARDIFAHGINRTEAQIMGERWAK